MNIEALLIASGQNIKRLVVARERGPRKLAQAVALRPPDPVSRCRSHVTERWPSFAPAKAYFNRLKNSANFGFRGFSEVGVRQESFPNMGHVTNRQAAYLPPYSGSAYRTRYEKFEFSLS